MLFRLNNILQNIIIAIHYFNTDSNTKPESDNEIEHLELVEEKEGKLARGEEIGGEDLRKYDLAEERFKEYGEFVKTGGYGLEPAGEDERISYSADQNVDIPSPTLGKHLMLAGKSKNPSKSSGDGLKNEFLAPKKKRFLVPEIKKCWYAFRQSRNSY